MDSPLRIHNLAWGCPVPFSRWVLDDNKLKWSWIECESKCGLSIVEWLSRAVIIAGAGGGGGGRAVNLFQQIYPLTRVHYTRVGPGSECVQCGIPNGMHTRSRISLCSGAGGHEHPKMVTNGTNYGLPSSPSSSSFPTLIKLNERTVIWILWTDAHTLSVWMAQGITICVTWFEKMRQIKKELKQMFKQQAKESKQNTKNSSVDRASQVPSKGKASTILTLEARKAMPLHSGSKLPKMVLLPYKHLLSSINQGIKAEKGNVETWTEIVFHFFTQPK